MEGYSSSKRQSIKEFIELLNEMGYVVVYINSEFYASTEFEPQDPGSNIYEHVCFGKDITDLVENSIDNKHIDQHRRREIITQIDQKKQVRRRFHRDHKYVVYATAI